MGSSHALSDKGWASAVDADGNVLLEAVSEVDTVALLDSIEKAAAAIDLLNTDYSRLKADSVAVDFQEFLEKLHVADIAKSAGYDVAAEKPSAIQQ